MTERLLVPIDDAAEQLALSRRSVQELIYRGALPSVRVGRRRLVASVDLVAFVDQLRAEARDSAGSPALEVLASK